jgi:hypothetical protein
MRGRWPGAGGVFAITALFGYATACAVDGGLRLPYHARPAGLKCVDDPARPITTASSTKRSGERLGILRGHAAPGPALRIGAVVAHNTRRRPGAGSCIFLHVGNAGHADRRLHRDGLADMQTEACWLDGARRRCWCSCPQPSSPAARPGACPGGDTRRPRR